MDLFVNDLHETMGPVLSGCIRELTGNFISHMLYGCLLLLNQLHIKELFRFLSPGETSMAYCYEAWGKHGKKRIFFSIFSLVVQFILPLTLIGMANYAIKRKLQNLPR